MDEDNETLTDATTFTATSDIYTQLLRRYGNSSASQHRHLLAAAAASRSLILSHSLPLSPLSYYSATIDSLSQSSPDDTDALSALATLLSVALPLVAEKAISPSKAAEAVIVLAEVVEREGEAASTSSVRAVVKCLGVLLGFCDLENWDEVKFGFEKLLDFSIDRRPKVRKCAQDCVLNVFKSFESLSLRKKAGKFVLSTLKQHMPDHQNVIHMLTLVKHVALYLPVKVSLKLLQQLHILLSSSPLARDICGVIEAIIKTSKDEILISEGVHLMKSLASYLSTGREKLDDTHLYAGKLLKNIILKFPISEVNNTDEIILELADIMNLACENKSDTDHLQECIGSAVCVLGPKRILTLIPLKLDEEELTCSNAWLISILSKYVTGSSFEFFVKYFVPLAKSFHKLSAKALKLGIKTDLSDYARAVWGLLPCFCHYSDDTQQNIGDMIFNLIKDFLQEGDKETQSEAYLTLSKILEVQPKFCSSHGDDLVDLLLGLKAPVDIGTLGARLSCFKSLLVHKVSNSDEEKSKAFLILNEVILTIKDSNEEVRKAAYDMLVGLGSNLKNSSSNDSLEKLISMMIGYLSGASPQIKCGVISALSILVHNNVEICILVPNLVPSILALLKNKALEVIKAVLGFVKVLVLCQQSRDLENLLPDIISAILPWSPVSRNHFREKVIVIFEVIIRKCSSSKVESLVPGNYKGFLKSIHENRHARKGSKETIATDLQSEVPDSASKGNHHKRKHEESRFQNKESQGNMRNKGRDFNRVSKRRKPSRGFGDGGSKFAKPKMMGKKTN